MGSTPADSDVHRDVLVRMADALAHRGPDHAGVWQDGCIGLAHRRLSILDRSPAGHQPMLSGCGRYVIAFSGRIYNLLRLRQELEYTKLVPTWRGRSDTEVLLAGFAAWGIKATIARSIGMFAFALWDKTEQVLTLGRDRIGEKPLYYGWQGTGTQACFIFGSELKALKAHPAFAGEIDRDVLHLFLRYGYIPAPFSIYRGIYKLSPGNLLTVSLTHREPVIEPYWSLVDVAVAGQRTALTGGPELIADELEALLKSAVFDQMLSDVPTGAFLSGGIDSATVAALMQAESPRPVRTFTIGFKEKEYNEAAHAKAVAAHLGTDHTELYVTPRQALEVIPKLPLLYCEPFADSSQIPTFLVAQLARSKVGAVLVGDGGDELFCGYNRYILAHRLWSTVARWPGAFRKKAAAAIRALSPETWNRLISPMQGLLPLYLRQANPGDKLHKGANVLGAHGSEELYLKLVSHWEPAELVIGGKEPSTLLHGDPPSLERLDDVQRMMVLDALTYLPDDGLVKVGRAAIGASLETCSPFLDHRVVEFAWRIPLHLKLRNGLGKWILRQVLYRYVPERLVERPKTGFGVPLDTWLRGPLRDWAETLLDKRRIAQEGFFNPGPIRQKWSEHLSGRRNWQYQLWCVLMFQAWLETKGR